VLLFSRKPRTQALDPAQTNDLIFKAFHFSSEGRKTVLPSSKNALFMYVLSVLGSEVQAKCLIISEYFSSVSIGSACCHSPALLFESYNRF
jgi:hypothetical protein